MTDGGRGGGSKVGWLMFDIEGRLATVPVQTADEFCRK